MASLFDKFLKRKADSAPAPNQFELLYDRAAAAAAARDFKRAVEFYDYAIALNPSHAEVYYKRGNALRNMGRFDAAVSSYDQAIGRKPDYAVAYCNRGVVQQAMGLTAEALSSYDHAMALDPADAMVHFNRALLMQVLYRWDEALAGYDRAISIDPEYSDAQYNRSVLLLFLGDFERGWRSYEWRWKIPQRLGIGELRNFTQPLWLGDEPIAGKRLLLHSEAGLGDTMQFCRYAPSITAMGATVYLEVQPPLLDLLAGLDGVSRVMAKGSVLPDFDFHCPLMSLPLAFKTTLPSVPAAPKYLRAGQIAVDRWLSALRKQGGPRIGLAWSGNHRNPIDQQRSIRLADWVAHLPPGFRYFCLQTQVRPEDQAALDSNPRITSFADDEMDFPGTAALCECMDVVISVDTSLAHLSGALGRPTWILLPFVPDWRWMLERDDSPWYPTAKLYRQRSTGDWAEVFERVAADLRRMFPGVPSPSSAAPEGLTS